MLTNEVDIHIGRTIKAFRTSRGMSLATFGEAIGRAYQQIHRYESGKDRVSASTLWRMSQVLGIDIAAFYPTAQLSKVDLVLAEQLSRIDPQLRTPLCKLFVALASEEPPASAPPSPPPSSTI